MMSTSAPIEPTALIVYESMFGNTEAVAQAVATGLRGGGMTATVVDVSDHPPTDVCGYDVLVVGAPTHAFSLSRASTRRDAVRQGARPGAAETGLREWLSAVITRPAGDHRYAAAFDTRASKVRRLPITAARRASRLLSEGGYTPLARPAGFVVEDVQGELLPGELDRAEAWGRRLATDGADRLLAARLLT